MALTKRFNRCVKKVAKKLPEGAAIAICTKSVLHKRGRTLKKYSKKRLITQKRGGLSGNTNDTMDKFNKTFRDIFGLDETVYIDNVEASYYIAVLQSKIQKSYIALGGRPGPTPQYFLNFVSADLIKVRKPEYIAEFAQIPNEEFPLTAYAADEIMEEGRKLQTTLKKDLANYKALLAVSRSFELSSNTGFELQIPTRDEYHAIREAHNDRMEELHPTE